MNFGPMFASTVPDKRDDPEHVFPASDVKCATENYKVIQPSLAV